MGGGDAGNDGGDSSNEEETVNIRCSYGSEFAVQVKLDSTVEFFKSIVAQKCEIPPQRQRLIYKGRILKDDQTLQSYGLEADHTVHLIRGFASAAPMNSTARADSGVTSTNSVPVTSIGSNDGGPLGVSLLSPGLGFNGLGSAGGGLFGSAAPEIEQLRQQLSQNPNTMGDILNMPLLQDLMNNPETIRNFIMDNPQIREIMDRNPELRHILNDPGTLRQTMEAARNPELMREMMRNTDRAMRNIESTPEGFNMLRRMYENVQEPFLNATTLAGDSRSDVVSNPFDALLGAQGGGSGRENLANPTTIGSETMVNASAPNTNPLPNPWASSDSMQTNSSARSNPIGDARPTSPGGFDGLDCQDSGHILGSMPDFSFNQLLQNPTMSQMMHSLLSNPQYMNQILGLNVHLQNMLDSSPQLRDMTQNPEFVRQMTSPEMMQQLLTFNQALSSQIGRQQTPRESGQNALGTEDNLGLNMLMNMFGGLGTGGGFTAPNRSQVPPEELYATQLSQLREMGFIDSQENIRALIATAGNVHAAVQRLLGNSGH
ncbi:ubiquitin domain-containing protein DSK2b isoform X1 [Sesamum indicum]|uniref:ubiquitin domain-containing protein DSK2b isoform X1 n=1 Tax=Sesamum indicum TaxID=4182 RepID=A0A6I9T5A6_SESIN|nr:ubiquitin domain-containing protein DSK2b isoform X1 [Sesamum indicum]XP_011079146.1 ubiquitin domain-containing protein DSK2b isoform X1 [Sesamum indicum]